MAGCRRGRVPQIGYLIEGHGTYTWAEGLGELPAPH